MSESPNARTPRTHDSDHDDIFDSPIKEPATRTADPTPSRHDRRDQRESRDAALREELENVRSVNKVVENVIANLQKARGDMDNVNSTVQSASTLLNTWTRILSQTEHNQRLILNPNWHGATQDLEDVENEAAMRQQAAERRAAEEQARRDAAARRAEEEERRRTVAPTTTRGTRGRVRGTTTSRPTSAATSNATPGYVGVGGQGGRGRASARAARGIGRGTRGTRGRGTS
ncbi:hypothetical protein AAFC00_007177 [Neodothiora populina]|uniref:DASH complex subunit DUO1 n=1 Tax=Neodothiora populina TaxID=2781224 RepID=A0ABR3PIK4_9PEZI